MNTEKLYKTVRNAGSWAFWLGVVQLVFIPLVVLVSYVTPDYTDSERLISAIIGSVFQLAFGVLLIVYGRKARAVVSSDPATLVPAAKARKILIITLAVCLLIAIVTGGRVGWLMLILLAMIIRAHRATKTLQAGIDPTVAQVPAATEPAPAPEPTAAPEPAPTPTESTDPTKS